VTGGRSERRPAPSTPPRGAGRTRTSELLAPPEEASLAPIEEPAGAPDEAGVSAEELDVLLRVGDMLRKLRFGTVLLVVHDGKVVQIETAEKIRL
jgi:hypothetical protein